MPTYGISVIICCYNSAERLPPTLKHLASQNVSSKIPWEIILVDNASTDNTKQIAIDEWGKYPLANANFSIIEELKPGKIYALHSGVQKSAYEYIVICDDDNWLNDNYIQHIYKVLLNNPSIGIVGGRGVAVSDIALPAWFKNHAHSYATGKQNTITGPIPLEHYLWGAGMGFRKSLYNKVYAGNPPLLRGDSVIRGEDVEFCMRVRFTGYTLFYDNELVFNHYIPKYRLSDNYKNKFLYGNEYEKTVLNLYYRQFKLSRFSFIRKIGFGISTFIRLFLSKLKFVNHWSYSYECEALHMLTGLPFKNISAESRAVHQTFVQLYHSPKLNR